MKRGPMAGRPRKTDFVAIARAAWGDALPDWVEELAEEATRSTGVAVAKKIGYAGAVVTQIVRRKYPGDIARVEQKVRGALMGATVVCPILGEIGRDRCLDEQKMPNSATSSIRSKLYRACRSGCPHSRIRSPDEAQRHPGKEGASC
jgi:hypothetical protein